MRSKLLPEHQKWFPEQSKRLLTFKKAEAFFMKFPNVKKFRRKGDNVSLFQKIQYRNPINSVISVTINGKKNYLMLSHDEMYKVYLGSGGCANVKLGIDKYNHVYAVRIEGIHNKSRDLKEVAEVEETSRDAGLLLDKFSRKSATSKKDFNKEDSLKIKEYSILFYGGVSVADFFQSNKYSLSFNQRFQIGIRIIEKVGQMHAKGIVHFDLKPENILINPVTFEVMIIDYDFSKKGNLQKTIDITRGTIWYLPNVTGKSISFDLFALMRTLWFPSSHKVFFYEKFVVPPTVGTPFYNASVFFDSEVSKFKDLIKTAELNEADYLNKVKIQEVKHYFSKILKEPRFFEGAEDLAIGIIFKEFDVDVNIDYLKKLSQKRKSLFLKYVDILLSLGLATKENIKEAIILPAKECELTEKNDWDDTDFTLVTSLQSFISHYGIAALKHCVEMELKLDPASSIVQVLFSDVVVKKYFEWQELKIKKLSIPAELSYLNIFLQKLDNTFLNLNSEIDCLTKEYIAKHIILKPLSPLSETTIVGIDAKIKLLRKRNLLFGLTLSDDIFNILNDDVLFQFIEKNIYYHFNQSTSRLHLCPSEPGFSYQATLKNLVSDEVIMQHPIQAVTTLFKLDKLKTKFPQLDLFDFTHDFGAFVPLSGLEKINQFNYLCNYLLLNNYSPPSKNQLTIFYQLNCLGLLSYSVLDKLLKDPLHFIPCNMIKNEFSALKDCLKSMIPEKANLIEACHNLQEVAKLFENTHSVFQSTHTFFRAQHGLVPLLTSLTIQQQCPFIVSLFLVNEKINVQRIETLQKDPADFIDSPQSPFASPRQPRLISAY